MNLPSSPYARADLAQALEHVGLRAGDTVFVHASLDTLGPAAACATPDERAGLVLGALQDVLGPGGTIVAPTYTFSFCRQEVFDIGETPTPGGPWSASADFLEYFRRHPGVLRSRDPIHSVAALGPNAGALVRDVPPTCFGAGSVHDRLLQVGGKICLLGVGLGEATFRHFVEERVGVPFRFQKLFTGQIRDNGSVRKQGWAYYVRVLADNCAPDPSCLEELARREGVCRAAPVGRGEVLAVDAPAYYALTVRELERDPWYTARGPAGDPVALDAARLGGAPPEIALPANATMPEMIEALWRVPRDIVSDGYDAALAALARQIPMTIHEYPTGRECWTWLVPEKWTCHEAYLETVDGRRVFSYADHPLHVVSYSLPFEGEVTREELFAHLHVHPRLEHAVPFAFKYYERDWGLCCSRAVRDGLRDDRYRVAIRTSFSYGTLKVGEVVVPGTTSDTIVLCAHLCHPAMVNDDLTGVVVGLDVMRALLRSPPRRYTYRFVIAPETIGSVAYLSQNPGLIPHLKGGLFLEMLGRDHPHALQMSFSGASELDRCCTLALRAQDAAGWTGEFRTIIGNDERQYNAPGVRVPMLSLSRVLRPTDPEWPYREYHSSADTPELVPPGCLEESRDLVLAMIDTLERNRTPVNRFVGEPFCSRYGIHVDAYDNPEGNRALFDLLFLIDGTRSIADLATSCRISFDAAWKTVAEIARHGLVELR